MMEPALDALYGLFGWYCEFSVNLSSPGPSEPNTSSVETMQKAEVRRLLARQRFPVIAAGLQQRAGADHILVCMNAIGP